MHNPALNEKSWYDDDDSRSFVPHTCTPSFTLILTIIPIVFSQSQGILSPLLSFHLRVRNSPTISPFLPILRSLTYIEYSRTLSTFIVTHLFLFTLPWRSVPFPVHSVLQSKVYGLAVPGKWEAKKIS